MDIKPIKTDADYRAALEDIEILMAAEPDSSEGEKLEVLATQRSLHKKKVHRATFYPYNSSGEQRCDAIEKKRLSLQLAVHPKTEQLPAAIAFQLTSASRLAL